MKAGRKLLINDEHVARQTIENPPDRIGLEKLDRTQEEILEHVVVEMLPGFGSNPLSQDVIEVSEKDDTN